MNRTSEFFTSLNWLIKPLMNSRFHTVLGGFVCIIKFTGRKSGQEFSTPVGYHKFGDTFLIALSDTRHRQWWRNYREAWPMQLKHWASWRSGTAVVIAPGSDEFWQWFEKIFTRRPFIARILKVHDFNPQFGLTAEQKALLLREGTGLVRFDAQPRG